MKKFNKYVSIQVDVDSIANKLLGMFNKDEKYAEIVTESIIGNLFAKNRLSGLFNSMNGYTTDINFKEGDIVKPEMKVYGYWTKESIEKDLICQGEVVTATIIAIDEYADNTLTIEYKVPKLDGTLRTNSSTIHHCLCSKTSSCNQ